MLALAAAAYFLGAAAAAAPRPAAYESSSGALEVTAAEPAGFRFHLQTATGAGNVCDLDGGFARKLSSAAYAYDDKDGCRIDFRFGAADAVVAAATDACRSYCGINASLAGEYRVRPKECAAPVAAARRRFQEDYRARRYASAAPPLARVLAACAFFFPSDDLAEDRSDLSIAFFLAGDKKACLEQIALARRENPALAPANLGELSSQPALERLEQMSKALSFNERKCSEP